MNEGGFQTIPKLSFPGGCIVGCSGSTLNVAKLKGVHPAMLTGQFAAEGIYPELENNERVTPSSYEEIFKGSDLYKELKSSRNVRPSFNTKFGWIGGMMYTGLFYVLGKGIEPWTLHHGKKDNEKLETKDKFSPIEYPKPDGKLTFDLMSSVDLTNTSHDEDEPCHLTLKDDSIPEEVNLKLYDGPESRFCPAGVYEFVPRSPDSKELRLQINAQNCIHCKTCDIKDPRQNINWVTPMGGEGPKYDGY